MYLTCPLLNNDWFNAQNRFTMKERVCRIKP